MIRERLDLSQSQMVKRLGSPAEKLRPGHISEIEAGEREPSLLVLLRYAKISGVPLEILVDDEEDLPKHLPAEVKYEWIVRVVGIERAAPKKKR
jgi:transcriptional regulator with XRE-family HTH domain